MTIRRFTKTLRCPICGGYDNGAERGKGQRCYGFLSADEKYAHCTREEHAGKVSCNLSSGTYAHRLIGNCKCGISHRQQSIPKGTRNPPARIVETYDYKDESGKLIFQVVRYEPKSFKQRRPNGHGGFIWNLDGVRRVLYCLRELLEADSQQDVFIVEGEKDVDRLRALGFVATTSAGGAGKWHDDFAQYVRGRKVILLPDNDDKGRSHIAQIARSLNLVAASVKVLELPNLPEHGDVCDWLDAGGTVEQLLTEVSKLPLWQLLNESHSYDKEIAEIKASKSSQATRLVELTTSAGV